MNSSTPYSSGSSSPGHNQQLGTWERGRLIITQSWALLRQDKEILWLPVLSGLFNLSLFGVFLWALFTYGLGSDVSLFTAADDRALEDAFANAGPMAWGIIFLYYVAFYVVASFFDACIFIIASARMNGKNLSLTDGIRGALARFGSIVTWSLIAGTFGFILNMIEQRSNLVGKVVTFLLGAAWALLTFFSLPALIIGHATIIGAFKESAMLIQKRWGEVIVITIGLGIYYVLAIIVGAVMIFASLQILYSYLFPVVAGVIVFYFIAVATILSALSSIFRIALYEYARTGQAPAGFSPEVLQLAVRGK